MKFDVRAIAIAALLCHAVAVLSLVPREDCNTSADWQLNSGAWMRANADINIRNWWAGISSKPHQSVPSELGKAFGDHHPYECGLLDDSSCTAAGCKGRAKRRLSMSMCADRYQSSNERAILRGHTWRRFPW